MSISMDLGEKLTKSRFFGISVEQIWVRKTITIWTPARKVFLFRTMKNLDFGGQISPTDRSLFSLNSPIRRPEKGGPRAKTPGCFPWISEFARGSPASPAKGRKRHPLGAGKHAAELG